MPITDWKYVKENFVKERKERGREKGKGEGGRLEREEEKRWESFYFRYLISKVKIK